MSTDLHKLAIDAVQEQLAEQASQVNDTLQVLKDALSGSRGADQQRIAEDGVDFIETLLRKNKDYGSSAWNSPMLLPELTAGDAILVRMGDKIHRIQTLLKQPPEVADESLRDTIKDLGGYCLLWLSKPEVTL